MRDLVSEQRREVESGGYEESASFTINATAKAFRILIDSLYSDKPRAIIRELTANAFDSHKAAGCEDTAFYLRLPTKWDSTFCVRDFGIGMSHKQVMSFYNSLFLSTKDMENVSVGKFGLGAKTPFAYTDAFALACVMDGTKRIYNAFIDPEGIPKIALFAEMETDEANGVEVSFPVKQEDISTFVQAAERVLLGFDVSPIICSHPNMVKDHNKHVITRGENYRIFSSSSEFEGNHIRQGCVIYPLDRSVLKRVATQDQKDYIQTLSDINLVLDMPIGTVEITPSRENLSYDAPTIANLIAALEPIAQNIVQAAIDRIAAAPTMLAAKLQRNKEASSSLSYNLQNIIKRQARWKGRCITQHISLGSLNLRDLQLCNVYTGYDTAARFNKLTTRGSTSPEARPIILYYTGAAPPHGLQNRIRDAMDRLNKPNGRTYTSANNYYLLREFNAASPGFRRLVAAWGDFDDLMSHMVCLEDVEFTPTDLEGLLNYVRIYREQNASYNFCKPKNTAALTEAIKDKPVYVVYKGRSKIAFRRGVDGVMARAEFRELVSYMKGYGALEEDAVIVSMPLGRGKLADEARMMLIPPEWEAFDVVLKKVGQMLDPAKVFKQELQGKASDAYELLKKFRKSSVLALVKDEGSRLLELVSHIPIIKAKLASQDDGPDQDVYKKLKALSYEYVDHLSPPLVSNDISEMLERDGESLKTFYPLVEFVFQSSGYYHGGDKAIANFAYYINLEDQKHAGVKPDNSDMFFNISVS